MIDRRTLLQALLAGTAGAALPRVARANPAASKLVVVFAYGGWDTTYLFDPKPGVPSVDQVGGQLRGFGALNLWSNSDMPAVYRFFQRWGSLCGVLNGVAVNSLVHETCLARVLAGDVGTAGLGVRMAEMLGSDAALPYLTLGGSAQVRGYEAFAGQLGYGNQLSTLVEPSLAFPGPDGGFEPDPGQPLSPEDQDLVSAYLQGAADRVAADRGAGGRNDAYVEDYRRSVERADAMAASARAGGWLGDQGLFYEATPWNKVAAALEEGFSQAVFVQDGGYWDTHGGNGQQASLHDNLFGSLDALLAALNDRGLLATTTVLVVSEMGRSPLLNVNAGKDHWPFTSAMLVGERVQSGMVGTTNEQLAPQPMNLATGAFEEGGHLLQTVDVLATVAELCGLDGRAMYPSAEVVDALIG